MTQELDPHAELHGEPPSAADLPDGAVRAPGEGEGTGGAEDGVERVSTLQRLDCLEKAFAGLSERFEQLAREHARGLAAAGENMTALSARCEACEDNVRRGFESMGANAAAIEARIIALEDRERAPAPPGGAEAPRDQSLHGEFGPPAPEPPLAEMDQGPGFPPAGDEAARPADFLTSARHAVLAAARDGGAPEKSGMRKDKAARLLAAAILAPVLILGTALTALNRNTVTASPLVAVPPAADRPQTKFISVLAPIPAGRPVSPDLPDPGPLRTLAVLKSAAAAGDVTAMREAGLTYLSGHDSAVSEADAALWLIRAAYRGDAEAQYWLATLYAQGRGVPKDVDQAMHWYGTAAKQGHRRAMHNLAVSHYEGWKGDKDIAQAIQWFEAASALGYADSAFNLAVLAETGTLVSKDEALAFKWYSIAAAAGDKEASLRVEIIAQRLSPEELETASAAVAAFKPNG